MADLYYAVLFGGRSGSAVTVDDVTNYIALTDHGLKDATGVAFKSGSLPSVAGTALAVDTTYYVKSISASTFELYYDVGLTSKIDFTSIGSDLLIYSAMWVGMSAAQRLRYGPVGAERVYGGVLAAYAAYTADISRNHHIYFEVLMAFTESGTTFAFKHSSLSLTLTSFVDGVPTEAFHAGVFSGGYALRLSSGTLAINPSSFNIVMEGLEFLHYDTGGTNPFLYLATAECTFRYNILRSVAASPPMGMHIGASVKVYGNIVSGFSASTSAGIYILNGAQGMLIANNLVTKCGIGIKAYGNGAMLGYNNIVVGNTVNWSIGPSYESNLCFGNIGDTSDEATFTRVSTSTLRMASAKNLRQGVPCTIRSTGNLPAVGGVPLDPNRTYWVMSVTGTDFSIGLNKQGVSLSYSDYGTGVHTVSAVWASTTPAAPALDFTDPSLVFMDWANDDYRPAGYGTPTPGSQALMVDADFPLVGFVMPKDIQNKQRPAYKNGAAEYLDAGPFEFDFGYGPRPASHQLTLENVVVGSQILVRDQANTTTHYLGLAADSTVVLTLTVYGSALDNWTIRVRSGSNAPFYQPWSTQANVAEGASAIYVSQIPDE